MQEKLLPEAQIPTTLPLLSKAAPLQPPSREDAPQLKIPDIQLGDLDPDLVQRFLSSLGEGLTWEFVALGWEHVDRIMYPKYRGGRATGHHATEADQLPVYQNYKILKEATDNQRQGSGHEDARLSLIKNDPDIE